MESSSVTIDNGEYPVVSSHKSGDDNFIFVIKNGKHIQVNAPHLRDLKLIDCTKVTIDNSRKKTPIMIHTAYSYISACNYTVLN